MLRMHMLPSPLTAHLPPKALRHLPKRQASSRDGVYAAGELRFTKLKHCQGFRPGQKCNNCQQMSAQRSTPAARRMLAGPHRHATSLRA